MADDRVAARRIMAQYGEESHLPYLDIPEGDVGVLIAFPIVGLLAASLIGVESLALPLAMAGLGAGAVVIYVTPRHLTAWTWLQDLARYTTRPRVTLHASPEEKASATEGGLGEYVPFRPDERTQSVTNIARAWPGAGAIERTDGTMEAYLKVRPGNMDFAMSEDWAELQAAGAEFANKELDHPMKFHATTRAFPVDALTETIEDRLDDPDVEANPMFAELLAEYRESRPREMREQGIQEIQYYLGVSVAPIEVYDRFQEEATPAERLTQLPIVGILFRPFVTRRADLTPVERRAKMFETLDSRIASVESEFVQSATGWTARRLSTVELFGLAREFWTGHETGSGDPHRVLRTSPVLNHTRREDDDA